MPGKDEKAEEKHLRRLSAMETERRPFEDEWKDITKLIFPRRNGWDKTPDSNKRNSPERFDGEALAALTLMCDGLLGHLVPAAMPFFRLRPTLQRMEKLKPLRQWLDDCQLHLMQVLERSNFYSAMGEAFPDAGSLGTACVFMEEEMAVGKMHFSVRHLKECYIAENRWGDVDTVYRRFMMTRSQLVEQFEGSLDQKQLDRAEKEPDALVEVLHIVEPGTSRKYDSTYMLTTEQADTRTKILEEGGYDWFPYIVWRFRKNSDEVYGRSPAMDALYDVEMINHQSKSMAEAAHKAINPPLLAHESMRGHIKVNPGAINYWDSFAPGGNLVQSLYGGALGQYPLGIDAMERRAKIIREHFRSDFFSYLLGEGMRRDRTATEINAIEAQKAAVMGSTIGRINKELLEPIIMTVFTIERESGRLPELPRELAQLAGMPIDIEYTGPMAMKQKQYLRSQGVMDGIAAVSQIAQATGRIDVFDNFNFDSASEEAASANGLPDRMIIDPRQVAKMRQARAQQQAQQEQMAMELEQAKAMPGLSKAPEQGSPAARMA